MNLPGEPGRAAPLRQRLSNLADEFGRAYADFLALPTGIIVGFLILGVGVFFLDQGTLPWLASLRAALQRYVFTEASATAELLGVIASGNITIASITFSLILLAVQQSAGSLTFSVIDQFLRRSLNQVAFGYFAGLALYALLVLASVNDANNPVWGASLAFVFSCAALYLLVVLIYSTINQTRPEQIVEAIHALTVRAHERERRLARRTRRRPGPAPVQQGLAATEYGYVALVDVDAIAAAARRAPGEVEVVLHVSIGSFVAHGDRFAELRAGTPDAAAGVAPAVYGGVRLARQRSFRADPAYGVEQLRSIGWTTISSSKQDTAAGLAAVRGLRDLLATWAGATAEEPDDGAEPAAPRLPVVYPYDPLAHVLGALALLGVVASEGLQPQAFTEVVRALSATFDRLAPAHQQQAEDVVRRILSAMGDLVLTADLERALVELEGALAGDHAAQTAAAVRTAREALGRSVGELNSRSTRVPSSA